MSEGQERRRSAQPADWRSPHDPLDLAADARFDDELKRE
jgi:hypothetical protein